MATLYKQENPQPDEPFNYTTFWHKNKMGILIVSALVILLILIFPHIKKLEKENHMSRADRKANFHQFVTKTLGKPEVIDGYWDHNGHYGATISTDVSKPMTVVKCRHSDDACWVVRVVN